jgi:hypothetical protein
MTNLIDIITPTNLLSEQAKFLASSTYNPVFHYFWQDQPLKPQFSVTAKYPLWDAIEVQDHDGIVAAAKNLFEVEIDESLLSRARSVAETKGRVSQGSAEEYAKLLRDALDVFGLHHTQVVLSEESGFNARPNHGSNLITVSKHIHFEYFSMEGGVHHELVHVIRYHNGHYNNIPRSQHFLPTEEGLASWCQDNLNDDNGAAQHAIEYVASAAGLKGSLRDVYDCMRELGMSVDLAWKRACRHKFGFVNTGEPGDILKPAMYFANEEKVSQLSASEKLRLFIGKISLDELEGHPRYYGRWDEDVITQFFKL